MQTKEIKLSDWLTCKDTLLKLNFTEEEIEKALKDVEYNIDDLTDKKGFKTIPNYYKPNEVLKENYWFTTKKYDGEWVKEVRVKGYEVRIKAQYQGLRHSKFLHQLLSNKYNWFNSFQEEIITKEKPLPIYEWTLLKNIPEEYKNLTVKQLLEQEPLEIKTLKSLWDIYELRDEKDEIYLKTEFGSLYVPYLALVDKDFSLIENRMKSYANSYHDPINLSGFALNHRGRTKEEYKQDKIHDYNKMIKPLESKEAILLKKYLQS